MNTDLITEKIIGCGMKVSNSLGIGFLEKVYENALALELRRADLRVEQQKCIFSSLRGDRPGRVESSEGYRSRSRSTNLELPASYRNENRADSKLRNIALGHQENDLMRFYSVLRVICVHLCLSVVAL